MPKDLLTPFTHDLERLNLIKQAGAGYPESGIQTGMPGIGLDHVKHFPGRGQANQLSLDDELELIEYKEKIEWAEAYLIKSMLSAE